MALPGSFCSRPESFSLVPNAARSSLRTRHDQRMTGGVTESLTQSRPLTRQVRRKQRQCEGHAADRGQDPKRETSWPLRAPPGDYCLSSAGGGHIDVFGAASPGQRVHRTVPGPTVWLAGSTGSCTRSPPRSLTGIRPWPGAGACAGSLPLALALLAAASARTPPPDDRWEATTSWRLHEQFAGESSRP